MPPEATILSTDPAGTASAPSAPPSPRPCRWNWGRRVRWIVRGVVGTVLLVITLAVILTQTGVAGRWLLNRVATVFNLNVDAGGVWVGSDGKARLHNARVAIPGMRGPAGELLAAGDIEATIDWSTLASGSAAFKGMTIRGPVLRLSQNVDTGALNIDGISIPSGADDGKVRPLIQIEEGVLELGEHSGDGGYTKLRTLKFDGTVSPAANNEYVINFRQREAAAGEKEFAILGTIEGRALKLSLRDLDLTSWAHGPMPTRMAKFISDLNVQGAVTRAEVEYDPATGGRSTVILENVGLTLPIEPQDLTADPLARPRMQNVNGSLSFTPDGVSAKLSGLLNDLPYSVDLDYNGYDERSGFSCVLSCRGFVVDKDPELLPFVPKEVRRRLTQFSSPTAEVSTQITLARAAPVDSTTELPEIRYQGVMSIKHGEAAFEAFPYKFSEISGQVRFSNDEIVFDNMEGRASTGARLWARARIAPPTDEAAAEIEVRATGAPLDDTLATALGPTRRAILDELIDRPKFESLAQAGLVPTEGPRAFEPGGRVNVHVKTQTSFGKDQPWRTQIQLSFPELAIVPRRFGYPLYGRDVRVEVLDDDAELVSGTFVGLAGGETELRGTFKLPSGDGPDDPSLGLKGSAAFRDVPIDRSLMQAILLAANDAVDQDMRNFLNRCSTGGTLDGRIQIGQDAGIFVTLHDAVLETPASASAHGDGSTETIAIRALNGDWKLAGGRMQGELMGQAWWTRAGQPPAPVGDVRVQATELPDEGGGKLQTQLQVAVTQTSLEAPIEKILEGTVPEVVQEMAHHRQTYEPSGRARLLVEATFGDSGWRQASIGLSDIEAIRFQALSGAWESGPLTGAVHINGSPAGWCLTLDDCNADLSFNGERTGRWQLTGQQSLSGSCDQEDHLRAAFSGMQFEGALARHILADNLGPTAQAAYADHQVRGEFDGFVELGAEGKLTATISPRTLTFFRGDHHISFQSIEGEINIADGGGVIRGLKAAAVGWSVNYDGEWTTTENSEYVTSRGRLIMEMQSWNSEAIALLPQDVRDGLEGAEVRTAGPVSFAADVTLRQTSSDDFAVELRGDGSFTGLRTDAGVEVTDAEGRFDVTVEPGPDDGSVWSVNIWGQKARVENVQLSDARVTLLGSEAEEAALAIEGSANSHGGRMTARAVMDKEDDILWYQADVRLSGVQALPVLGELGTASAESAANADPSSRGLIDGELTIRGIAGDEDSRRGRGSLRTAGGRVIDVPLMLLLIRASNFQLPGNGALDYAQAQFFIDGPIVYFNDLSVYSRALAIEGYGTMSGPEHRLDLRFDSRATRRIPIVNWLVESVRNELITTRVRGPLSDPEVKLEEFPGTRRMLDDAFGRRISDRQRRLDRLDRYGGGSLRPIQSHQEAIHSSNSEDLEP